ncbi:Polyprotein, related [Eimeria brunetti]|uniref:Polyprotein, related n=1 Tax=Eimeria brunetti TaxID=51314 RepID=U6LKE5_9EIME|nr:Polyprotein, related [Eimeria brunetti]
MTSKEAAAILRPPPERYKPHAEARKKVKIGAPLQQANADMESLRDPLKRFCLILALPKPADTTAVRMPQKWTHHNRILLVSNKLPAKSAIYRMTPDRLDFHKQEIAKVTANGWIGPKYSPICAPTIMVGIKGGPVAFQGNINAYLQNLIGLRATAYLDSVLTPSADPPSHAQCLWQRLSIFLARQFYPKFRKCMFAKRQLTYLRYSISAEGIGPALYRIKAIRVYPEAQENEIQARQLFSTVNYCRMFMGIDYTEVARTLVDLTAKVSHFVPAKKLYFAADTVEFLPDCLIRYNGFPEMLIPDCDPRLQSELWLQLFNRFDIKRAMSSSYHPQSDCQTERVSRTLELMEPTYIQSNEREWERLLPA